MGSVLMSLLSFIEVATTKQFGACVALFFVMFLAVLPQQASAQATPQTPPVYADVQDLTEQPDRFEFQVGLTNAQRVQWLHVELWSDNRRIDRKSYENPLPVLRDFFLKSLIQPGREYQLQIRAEDRAGRLIALPSSRESEAPVTLLAVYEFSYVLPAPEPIVFSIRALIPYLDRGVLRIELGGVDAQETGRIDLVEGIIFDSNNQPIDSFTLEELPSLSVERPLPKAMLPSTVERKFVLIMYMRSKDGMDSEEAEFEITMPAAPTPSFGQRVSNLWFHFLTGIEEQPLLFVGVVVVLLNTIGWLFLRKGRKKPKSTFLPPPIDNTVPGIRIGTRKSIVVQVVKSPDKTVKPRTFNQASFAVGRSNADLVIRDERITAKHALIKEQNGGLLIQDCASKNGTFINGNKIASGSWVEIHSQDIVRLGPATEIRLELQS